MNRARIPAGALAPEAADASTSPAMSARLANDQHQNQAVGPGQTDHSGNQVNQPDQDVPEYRPGSAAAEWPAGPRGRKP
jgi:hypothetical protein